jgi:hypothetical protein
MPPPPPTQSLDDVREWFTHLRAFRTACVGNNTPANLLAFANETITTILPTTAEQQNFVVKAVEATGYNDMDVSDLANRTFLALLDIWNPLITPLAQYLWGVSPLNNLSSGEFYRSLCSDAFPGGGNGPLWKNANQGLANAFDTQCFTLGFQTKIAATVSASTTKISDLVPKIAVLG